MRFTSSESSKKINLNIKIALIQHRFYFSYKLWPTAHLGGRFMKHRNRMHIYFVLVLLLSITSAFSQSLKILQHTAIDQIVKLHTKSPKVFLGIDDSKGFVKTDLPFRLDLIMADLIDQLYIVMNDKKLVEEQSFVASILKDKPLENFPVLLKILVKNEEDKIKALVPQLEKKWIVQEYNLYGNASLYQVQFIRKQRFIKINRNKLVTKYNAIGSDSESTHILRYMRGKIMGLSPIKRLTVTKMNNVKKKELKTYRSLYYAKFLGDLKKTGEEYSKKFYKDLKLKVKFIEKPDSIVAHKIKDDKSDDKIIKQSVIPLYNAIHSSPFKLDLVRFLVKELMTSHKTVPIPNDGDRFYITDIFVLKHLDLISEYIKEYTYRTLLLGMENDQVILKLRRWAKKNSALIETKLSEFNDKKDAKDQIALSFEVGRTPKRYQIIQDFSKLEILFPDAPWMEKFKETVLGRRGHPIILGKDGFSRFMYQVSKVVLKIVAPENLAGTAAGILVTLASGNVMVGSIANVLVKDSLHTLIHNKKFTEGFKETPWDVAKSVVSYAPWLPGHYLKIFSVGVFEGTLQGILTGQNILAGGFVGGTFEVAEALLPMAIGKPTIKFDIENPATEDILANIALEVGHNAIKKGLQGGTVALITNQHVASGFAKGAAYGAGEAALKITLFGVRVNLTDHYSETEIQDMLDLESDFQNYYGVGEWDLKVTQIMDTDWRYQANDWVGNVLKLNGGRSFTGPGFIAIDVTDFNLLILSHEASHLGSQDFFGLYGFYYNWVTMALKTGTNASEGNIYENYMYQNLDGIWTRLNDPSYALLELVIHTGLEKLIPAYILLNLYKNYQDSENFSQSLEFDEFVDKIQNSESYQMMVSIQSTPLFKEYNVAL